MLETTGIQLGVPLAVVQVEPDEIKLILELPHIRAALSFAHQVLMGTLHDWCLQYCIQELADLQKLISCDLFSHACRPLIVVQELDQTGVCDNGL